MSFEIAIGIDLKKLREVEVKWVAARSGEKFYVARKRSRLAVRRFA